MSGYWCVRELYAADVALSHANYIARPAAAVTQCCSVLTYRRPQAGIVATDLPAQHQLGAHDLMRSRARLITLATVRRKFEMRCRTYRGLRLEIHGAALRKFENALFRNMSVPERKPGMVGPLSVGMSAVPPLTALR